MLQLWEYNEARARAAKYEPCRMLHVEKGETLGATTALIRTIAGRGAIVITRPLGDMGDELPIEWVEKRKLCLFVDGEWHSARLDLRPSQDGLETGLRKNWRKALYKARESGVITGIGTKLDFMCLRDNSTVSDKFLETFQALATERHKLRIFTAMYQSEVIGVIATAQYGTACEYLAASITDEGRRLNAGQLLLWEAVLWAKNAGYASFDVGGLSTHLDGVNYFKEGLNATEYRSTQPSYEAFPDTLLNRFIRSRVRKTFSQLAT